MIKQISTSAPSACRIGIVSDTHMPERCAALPPALFAALEGVDLLLHAGDVGKLWVLDHLSQIAPVVAVHGNDDTEEAQRELPYQQVIATAGKRFPLCHGHRQDLGKELESRRDDAWEPKLRWFAELGEGAEAAVVVFGHLHVPLVHQQDGTLLVNPGAIASPNYVTRQTRQTVAVLSVDVDGAASVVHIDLTRPDAVYRSAIDWSAGFRAALESYSRSILAPDLAADWEQVRANVHALPPDQERAARAAMLRAARQCWSGERDVITRATLQIELKAAGLSVPSLV